MGRYINKDSRDKPLSKHFKAEELIEDGAILLPIPPAEWMPNLVCVVDNGYFQAALYVEDKDEFNRAQPHAEDDRPRRWLVYRHAEALAKPTI